MTDPSRTPRPRRRKPSAVPVIAGSLAAFFGLFGFMSYELGTGHDPALGNKTTLAAAPAPRRVLVKRLERHIIVTKIISEEQDDAPAVASAPVVAQSSAPIVVQQAAPTPVYAPAPAPAPVVTKTS